MQLARLAPVMDCRGSISIAGQFQAALHCSALAMEISRADKIIVAHNAGIP